jgi:hypothetical protein
LTSESKDIELSKLSDGSAGSESAGCLPLATGHSPVVTDFVTQAINDCRNNAPLAQEIMALYDRLERELGEPGGANVRCLGGGACCRFDRLEHRLWASCGEIALLLRNDGQFVGRSCGSGIAASGFPIRMDALPNRCPWQLGPRCLARQARPLGCRTYFCQKQYDNCFHAIYETYHDLIRTAHQRHCVTYAYTDVLAAILQLSAT